MYQMSSPNDHFPTEADWFLEEVYEKYLGIKDRPTSADFKIPTRQQDDFSVIMPVFSVSRTNPVETLYHTLGGKVRSHNRASNPKDWSTGCKRHLGLLDEAAVTNQRDCVKQDNYVICVREDGVDRQKAQSVIFGSAVTPIDITHKKIWAMTLYERLLYEAFFMAKFGSHPDCEPYRTVCAGSLTDGSPTWLPYVPSVSFNEEEKVLLIERFPMESNFDEYHYFRQVS